jgi:hypothetical protein
MGSSDFVATLGHGGGGGDATMMKTAENQELKMRKPLAPTREGENPFTRLEAESS